MTQRTNAGVPRRQVLTDLEEIRRWAEARGGVPARIIGSGSGDAVGGLRIAFPDDQGNEALAPLSWEAWFAMLVEQHLAFVVEPCPGDPHRGHCP